MWSAKSRKQNDSTIMNARFGYRGARLWAIIASLFLMLASCASTTGLTEAERQKLDPPLQRLLTGERVSESEYDIAMRLDGSKEYAVVVRSNNADELKKAGIRVSSVFGDVVTVRVTLEELRKIVGLSTVRSMQNGSKNFSQ
jgi:hypothetical protein